MEKSKTNNLQVKNRNQDPALNFERGASLINGPETLDGRNRIEEEPEEELNNLENIEGDWINMC